MDAAEKIIVALDCDRAQALKLAARLEGASRWVKVGMTLYYQEGPSIVEEFKNRGFSVFLDLKFSDIPHQVEGAAAACAATGADILSIHALAGKEALSKAAKAVSRENPECALIAITVLTSLNAEALHGVGIDTTPAKEAERLSHLAKEAGLAGVVCSGHEAHAMREIWGKSGLIVCPGVRPKTATVGDQARVMTPSEALLEGASKLVIGRPITEAADPLQAFKNIEEELS